MQTEPAWESDGVQLYHGDCLDVMPSLPENSVDSVVTDPPYGLEFMGKDWDHGIPGVRFWRKALRVAKPGAMLLAFGGTRTHHRLMCAIEDAGWEIRDVIMWVYGSGFPKSHAIGKAIDKAAGAEREVVGPNRYDGRRTEGSGPDNDDACYGQYGIPGGETAPATSAAQLWDGWGTALKPAYEPIIVAMKPRDGTFANNALKWGVAGLWVDGGRVGTEQVRTKGRSDLLHKDSNSLGNKWSGVVDTSPHRGRWPANLIHDGSEEVLAGFPENAPSGGRKAGETWIRKGEVTGFGGKYAENCTGVVHRDYVSDSGSAARFFYCAKSSRAERNAGLEGMEAVKVNDGRKSLIDNAYQRGETLRHNPHPTVKPLALMRYLCRITRTPTGGVVLDMFMGSGSTGVAAVEESRGFIGVEKGVVDFDVSKRRIQRAQMQPRLF